MVNWVLLSVMLVVATAACIGFVVILAMNHQVERATDRRLADGSALFQSAMEYTREDLMASGTWLSRDREFIAAVAENRPKDAQERISLALRLQAVDEVVADTRGRVLAELSVEREQTVIPRTIAGGPGFR